MKIKGLLDPRLRGDDNKASFRMRTSSAQAASSSEINGTISVGVLR